MIRRLLFPLGRLGTRPGYLGYSRILKYFATSKFHLPKYFLGIQNIPPSNPTTTPPYPSTIQTELSKDINMSNIWIAASDGNTSQVLSYLSARPSLVNAKDENGYTPIHAAASYGHLDLLRTLIKDHGGDVNLRDDDGDTPLFTAETVEVAKLLVEELGADWSLKNDDGLTAAESIEGEDAYPLVAEYLQTLASKEAILSSDAGVPPAGIAVNLTSMDEVAEELKPVDEEFKRKIEELASRPGEYTQEELRQLVTEAVHKHILEPEERNVKAKESKEE
ncbi:hypothetical protein TWF594_002204 [Orbilia oligospora]|uniref:Uncharacterized protein n=2 Tax=Orbilia oligospora TaxID=2813651 RepID=A0A7C8JWF6_ORBOL|nr:hypothetical protein TWF103_004785 [Orbilia oligospora]KAF3123773.1 hypothetical protein TWF594_002204 [Orbilia oligospora]KAF3144601.1 hypothetical protein TWF703_008587 [Orbilia oligospora]